ncbi:MAG: ferritin-like domain-containing protein [Planctomycetia bacterium]|nr:ferritin-like domain-containing protein [Planctomycetia bacterium]
MKLASLEDLYVDELKDLYSAENQLLKALPKMADAAHAKTLKNGFLKHLRQTERHVERLKKVCAEMDVPPTGKTCKAMKGLIEEGQEVIDEDADPDVKDAALIAAAQRVEHYEMAGYGCVRTYAELLGKKQAARLLQQTLNEEGATDKTLTRLAKRINVAAETGASGNGKKADAKNRKSVSLGKKLREAIGI